VYFEDADIQGVVHHPNYLRFFERARTEFLEALGHTTRELESGGCHLTVYEARVKYRRPARIDDRLEVISQPVLASPYRITFRQAVLRTGEEKPLCEGELEIVCLDDDGELMRVPEWLLGIVTT
jgi:tol-pal system-associated acyl-CoA thioesterase